MTQGSVSWQSPSNIALVKYWGKHGRQLPRNPSISFTLDKAHSKTTIHWKKSGRYGLEYAFHGKPKPDFKKRIDSYLHSIREEMPWIEKTEFKIESENSFPHSSGIASSASFMSSLALCLCDIESEAGVIDRQKASDLARLGSGSACRSVYGGSVLWGSVQDRKLGSDTYAQPLSNVDTLFESFHNDILIVSDRKKSVSSTAGHALMESHPFAQARYRQARENIIQCIDALRSGNIDQLGQLMEEEALTLHGLMMNSPESYILLKPKTLVLIDKIRNYRHKTGRPVYFTLDAGPNIHLLYPARIREEVKTWRQMDIDSHCLNVLEDRVGSGPIKINL